MWSSASLSSLKGMMTSSSASPSLYLKTSRPIPRRLRCRCRKSTLSRRRDSRRMELQRSCKNVLDCIDTQNWRCSERCTQICEWSYCSAWRRLVYRQDEEIRKGCSAIRVLPIAVSLLNPLVRTSQIALRCTSLRRERYRIQGLEVPSRMRRCLLIDSA